jgi:uncharacterized delta-60 repeat protein
MVKSRFRSILLIFLNCSFYCILIGQAGSLDTSFNPGKGADKMVNAICVFANGHILIGGNFKNFNDTERHGLALLDENGSLIKNAATKNLINTQINALCLQSDGKIIAGGWLKDQETGSIHRIIRLESDLSVDNSFNSGTGPNLAIHDIAVGQDGKIYIAGNFTEFDGVSIYRIARLLPDGSLDKSFDTGTGANLPVNRIVAQADGKIIIAGQFSEINGSKANAIARLMPDGSLDTTFVSGEGVKGTLRDLCILPDGKIMIGGSFSAYSGIERQNIARLNQDGSLDEEFNSEKGTDFTVETILALSSGKTLISGWFTKYSKTPRKSLARLDRAGALDIYFNPGRGAYDKINTMVLQTDEKIIIGGWFTDYGGILRNRIARIHNDDAESIPKY